MAWSIKTVALYSQSGKKRLIALAPSPIDKRKHVFTARAAQQIDGCSRSNPNMNMSKERVSTGDEVDDLHSLATSFVLWA